MECCKVPTQTVDSLVAEAQKSDFVQPSCETKFFSLRVVYEGNVRYFELRLRAPDHNWSGSAPLCCHIEEKMYTE